MQYNFQLLPSRVFCGDTPGLKLVFGLNINAVFLEHKIQTLVKSGSTDVEVNEKLSDCVLGYLWLPSTVIMGIKFIFDLSENARGSMLSLT